MSRTERYAKILRRREATSERAKAVLVLEASLGSLEARRHGEDRRALLRRPHGDGGEGAAVGEHLAVESDVSRHVAAAEKVAAQLVDGEVAADKLLASGERLCHRLAAVHSAPPEVDRPAHKRGARLCDGRDVDVPHERVRSDAASRGSAEAGGSHQRGRGASGQHRCTRKRFEGRATSGLEGARPFKTRGVKIYCRSLKSGQLVGITIPA